MTCFNLFPFCCPPPNWCLTWTVIFKLFHISSSCYFIIHWDQNLKWPINIFFNFMFSTNHFTDCPFSTSHAFHWLSRSWNHMAASDDQIKRKGWLHLLISAGNWMNNKCKHDALDACRCQWRQKRKVLRKSSHFGSSLKSGCMHNLRHWFGQSERPCQQLCNSATLYTSHTHKSHMVNVHSDRLHLMRSNVSILFRRFHNVFW